MFLFIFFFLNKNDNNINNNIGEICFFKMKIIHFLVVKIALRWIKRWFIQKFAKCIQTEISSTQYLSWRCYYGPQHTIPYGTRLLDHESPGTSHYSPPDINLNRVSGKLFTKIDCVIFSFSLFVFFTLKYKGGLNLNFRYVIREKCYSPPPLSLFKN